MKRAREEVVRGEVYFSGHSGLAYVDVQDREDPEISIPDHMARSHSLREGDLVAAKVASTDAFPSVFEAVEILEVTRSKIEIPEAQMTSETPQDPLTDPICTYAVFAKAAGSSDTELIRTFARPPTQEEIRWAIVSHVRGQVQDAEDEDDFESAVEGFVDSYFDFPNGASIEVVRHREV